MKPTTTLGAGCLLISDNQVLLVKPNYGKAKGCWILPGGFVERGEPLFEAALRELKEETGQDGIVQAPLCVRYRLDPSDVYWVFRVRSSGRSQILVQSEELVDVQYLPIEFAMRSDEVRPMTRYFIECSLSKNPRLIPPPPEYDKNNFVYFFDAAGS